MVWGTAGALNVAEFSNGPDEADRHVEALLEAERRKDLLRFSTAGSVDDGKSTLIGRLLYDSHSVYDDHVRSITSDSVIDFAQLTDGLRAEREQGITIDVAYRYFSTPRRKFIIADTPGHEQYTRNMATGASTADVAVVLVDARKGVLAQTRRHACIAALLGIPNVIAAVNKMDLVDFSEEVFERHRRDLLDLARQLEIPTLIAVPLSALEGDNVVHRSDRTRWYGGPSLLQILDKLPLAVDRSTSAFRFPVQHVIRPHQDFRGLAGQIAGGTVRPGDEVVVLPSGIHSRVRSIVTWDGDLQSAHCPQSIVLALEDEADISRGDMIASANTPPFQATRLKATVVWMAGKALRSGSRWLLKQGSRTVASRVVEIRSRIDVDRLANQMADELPLNAIGEVVVETNRPLVADLYRENRITGSFILIDPVDHATAGAGMVRSFEEPAARASQGALLTLGNRSELASELEELLLERKVLVVRTSVAERDRLLPLVHAGAVVIAESSQPEPIALAPGTDDQPAAFTAADARRILEELGTAGVIFTGGQPAQ